MLPVVALLTGLVAVMLVVLFVHQRQLGRPPGRHVALVPVRTDRREGSGSRKHAA